MADDSETSIKIYLQEISATPLLTVQEEIELAARIKKGDPEARAWMIKANLRLVVKIAHDYSNFGLPLLDLISEGNIGLIKGVERFDPAKGGKLSTYAAWWIKQSIKRALANQSKTIRLPVHLVDKISKMRRVSLQMSEELGREPTDDELGEEIGIAAGKVSQLKTVSIRPASLDAPISDDDSTEFGEIVGDEEAQTDRKSTRQNSSHVRISYAVFCLKKKIYIPPFTTHQHFTTAEARLIMMGNRMVKEMGYDRFDQVEDAPGFEPGQMFF